ncbi:hypothetical protein [Saccharibacillus alkalitolerans]|uniref:Uncharacterized protein n=1 Tax=Saccharibacillus alkalitolerans TaxID=2705290 RepID=A0ABX0FAH9_9BACL|nr:hypothetical protein [Saccharibacillus alkalitolerans]NGZ76965.1 hypothetical protein [Saccharibacillus alkalitolerans]
MINHMTTLGFHLQEEEELLDLADYAYKNGTPFETEKGIYVRLEAGGGAELWLQLNREQVAIGMQPHFTGAGLMEIGIEGEVQREEANELDGTFYAWAGPGRPGEGLYSFVFDLPDRDRYGPLTQPILQHVQLAAFAHELNVFGSEAEYNLFRLGQSPGEPIAPPESFVSNGLTEHGGQPISTAAFGGRVLRAGWMKNELTGLRFHWALVRTLGGDIDVVADERLVGEREIREGGILSGTFWLSGRLIPADH